MNIKGHFTHGLIGFCILIASTVHAQTNSAIIPANQVAVDTAATSSRSLLLKPLVAEPPSSTAPNTYPWPSTGPIGIGTTSPTSQLSVNGNSDIPIGGFFGTTLSDNLSYESKVMPNYGLEWVFDSTMSGAPFLWASGYGGIKLFTESHPRMTVAGNGNVGVGTVSPVQNFVVSNAGAEGLEVYLGQPTGTVGLQVFNRATSSYNKMELDASQLAVMDGNVGIGTRNPQSLLSVEGNITAKQITILQTGWSDFIFDSSYQRMSLDSISQYISQYKHLPQIPSTEEVEKAGLDLGAMQKLHMQKIEELTLYAIDADKRISVQNKTIDGQQQQLKEQQDLLLQFQKQLKVQQQAIDQLKQQLSSYQSTKAHS